MIRNDPVAAAVAVAVAVAVAATPPRADEFSGADKLRLLYSSQFAWTREGLPLATVRLAEALEEVKVRGTLRLLPDGEMGAEVRAGSEWTVRLLGPGKRARLRYHVVVARAPAAEAERLQPEAARWQERGFSPKTFEIGVVFGIRGEVIDTRRALLAIAPSDDEAAAQRRAREIAARYGVDAEVHPEVITRPSGTLEARDERGTVVRNDGALWFAALHPDDTLAVEPPGRRYAGQIYVTVDQQGKLAVVNAVAEDRLLSGLVPAEMNAGAPLESLKAQAVAARNQLLAKIGTRHLGDPYRLCAATHCQVYAGAGQETPRTTQAVSATRGELLVSGAALVDTVYSASCGGHTEDNDQAWGAPPDPLLRGHLDVPASEAGAASLLPFAGRIGEDGVRDFLTRALSPLPLCGRWRAGQASYRWQVRVAEATIRERAGAGLGALRDVVVLKRGASGRVVALRVVGSQGSREVFTELEVRRVLGGLKSALIAISPVRQGHELVALDVIGGGFGHGVGMCQQGAMAMGQAGAGYRQILEHYYPGARLRRLY